MCFSLKFGMSKQMEYIVTKEMWPRRRRLFVVLSNHLIIVSVATSSDFIAGQQLKFPRDFGSFESKLCRSIREV